VQTASTKRSRPSQVLDDRATPSFSFLVALAEKAQLFRELGWQGEMVEVIVAFMDLPCQQTAERTS
jgi:hypothetical protein